MARTHRPRRLAAGVLALLALLIVTGCASEYPNTTFNHTTEFNEAIDHLWDRLLFLGTLVFIGVEAVLLYVVFKFRRREGQPNEPRHVHGNTTLEILWTAIPAVILVFIAIPTVRTIFRTQAKAVPNALQVEVIGHQWWWEFRYPEYGITTANELYLPTGRTVNFALKTADVIHSFWIPRLGGKRDLIANHTNYLWMTPNDSMATKALNGSCNEYCGASHGNMKFRTYTVTPAEFQQWVALQQQPAAFTSGPTPAAPAAATPATPAAATVATTAGTTAAPATPPAGQQPATAAATPAPATAGWAYPKDRLNTFNIPTSPLPTGIAFPANLAGDAARGQQAFTAGGCIGCHAIAGNPFAMGKIGPNLTHIGSRYTIAGAMYPNEPAYLARWIKNAKKMKPGSLMPTLGKGETDPITGQTMSMGLSDQQIADIVAYLQALK